MDGKREQDAFLIIAHLLKRSNCDNTFLAFQKEVRSSLNLIDSVDAFIYEVNHGRWNVVLETILCFKLPVGKLIRLYEHIIFECVEAGHHDVAQTIFSKFDVMATSLKEDNYKKWLEIDKIIIRKSFNPKQVYAGGSKETARAEIAKDLSSELIVNSGLGYINLLQRELTRSIQDRERKNGRDGVRQSKVLSSKYYLVHETQPEFIQHWNFVIVKLESIVEEEAGSEGQARARDEIEALVRAEVERNDRLHQDQYQKTLATLEAPVTNNGQSGNNSGANAGSGVTLKALQQQLALLQSQGKKDMTQQQIAQNQEQVVRIQQQIRALLQGIGDKSALGQSGTSPTDGGSDAFQQQALLQQQQQAAEIEAARKRKEREETERKEQEAALEREKERARAQAQAELERREAEERAREERERLENERRENERREEEARRVKAQREESERREQERIENERRENERREAERRAEDERKERERVAAEQQRAAAEAAERERKRKQQEEDEKKERERKEQLEREEQERKEKERLAREQEEARVAQEKAAQEKAAQEKAAQEKAAQEKAAQEKAAANSKPADEPENDTTEFINQVGVEDRVVEWCQAFHAYEHAQPDPNFLSFAAGDCFRVILENSEELQGWRLVLDGQNRKGFIPGNYLKTISEDDYLQWEKKINDDKKKSEKAKQEKEQEEAERKKAADEKKRLDAEAAKRKAAEDKEREKAEKEKKRVNDIGLNTVDRRDRIKKADDVTDIRSNLPIAEAKYDYTHPDSTSTEFFSFKTGDKFSVLLNSPDLKGWTIVLNSKNEKGFVPGNYLTVAEVKSPRGKKGGDKEEHSTSSSTKGRTGRTKEGGKEKGKK